MQELLEKHQNNKLVSDVLHLPSVKGDLDEILREYFVEAEKYVECTFFTDIKIGVGCVSIVLAGILLFCSLKIEFATYKPYALLITSAFWLLTCGETLALRALGGYAFKGRHKEKGEIRVVTKINSPVPLYTVLLYFGKKQVPSKVSVHIAKIYDRDNALNYKAFINMLSEGME